MFSKGLKWWKEYRKRILEVRNFKNLLKVQQDNFKIVIGASEIYQYGWIPTEAHFLNLLLDKHWRRYFQENSIQFLLAEHVWEHLTLEQGYLAACNCYKYLKKGGKIRIAVPDGLHRDQSYIDYVRPGGNGAGADDHKILYDYRSLSNVFRKAGFEVELLEYFNEEKFFLSKEWSAEEGYIHRSIRFDERNQDGNPHYTSVILDAIKK
jgi:predicted SAM-dependent methyltransferase